MTDKKVFNINFFRTLTLAVVTISAIGSLYLMFIAGRNQKSIFLILLFTAWMLSPFVSFFLATIISKRWAASARTFLYWTMIILAGGSLIAYNGTFNTPNTKNAFVFLVVPFISWIIISIVFLISRRLRREGQ
jgi:hypothetical protein